MPNADRVGTVVPVDAIALGVWSEKTDNCYIGGEIASNNPYLELTAGKINLVDSKSDQKDMKPTAPLEKSSRVKGTESVVEYRRLSYRRSFDVSPANYNPAYSEAKAKLREQQKGARFITKALKLVFESVIAGKVFNASNFTNTTVGDAWTNYAVSNPVADLNAQGKLIKKARSIPPNTVIFGANAYSNYVSNEKIQKSIATTQNQLVKMAMALELLKTDSLETLSRIFVADATYNGANLGQTEDRNFVWDPDMVWIGFVETNPQSEDMSGAFALTAENFIDTMGKKSPVSMRSFRDENAEVGVETLEGSIKFDFPIIDPQYGRLLTIA